VPKTSVILWQGASLLDGAPIVAIATFKSRNAKTGDMVQTWILRADMSPTDALASGDDASICGDCTHRPANTGSCYVRVWQAPRSIWGAYSRGRYTRAPDLADVGAGRMVRLGSYGDPAAVPAHVWRELTSQAAGVTGYTHQWRQAPELMALCMASADSSGEAITARAMGWRTFRVRAPDEEISAREFMCPASKEAGYKTDCASCKACGGTSSRAKASPVIMAHGGTARRFVLTRNAVAA